MRAPAAALACLLLAACAGRGPAPPEGVAADDPRLAQCRGEAAADPRVQAIRRRMPPPSDGTNFPRALDEIRDAEQDAYLECLVRLGVVERPAGGVERVRSPRFGGGTPAPGGTALPPTLRPPATGY